MLIEFPCSKCGSPLSMPTSFAGKKCRCPTCQSVLDVPAPKRSPQIAPKSPATTPRTSPQRTEKPRPSAPIDSRLRIPCPKCEHLLICEPNLLGTKGQCAKCRTVFTIAIDPNGTPTASQAAQWVFACPQCKQLFEGNEAMRGRTGKCPTCSHVFEIQLKPADGASALTKPTAPTEPETKSNETAAPQPAPNPNRSGSTAKTEFLNGLGNLLKAETIGDEELQADRQVASPSARANPSPPLDETVSPIDSIDGLPEKPIEEPEPQSKPVTKPETTKSEKAATFQDREKTDMPVVEASRPVAHVVQAQTVEALHVTCPACQGLMEIPDELRNQNVACPHCDHIFVAAPSRSSSKPAPSPRPQPSSKPSTPANKQSAASQGEPTGSSSGLSDLDWQGLGVSASPSSTFGSTEPSATQSNFAHSPYRQPEMSSNPYASPRGLETPGRRGPYVIGNSLTFSSAWRVLFQRSFPGCFIILGVLVVLMIPIAVISFAFSMIAALLNGMELPQMVIVSATTLGQAVAIAPISALAYAVCSNIAYRVMRGDQTNIDYAFSTGGTYGSILIIVLVQVIPGVLGQFGLYFAFGAAPGDIEAIGPDRLIPYLIATMLVSLFVLAFNCITVFSPFALLEGYSLMESVTISARLLFTRVLTVHSILITALLAYILVSIFTCFLGAFILCGLPICLLATIYLQSKAISPSASTAGR